MSEAWTKINPRRATSDRGYSVEILGLEGILYQEGDEVLYPPTEPMAHGGFALHPDHMGGSRDRKHEIIERVRSGLSVLGETLIVDEY
jgi:hypothetical protein